MPDQQLGTLLGYDAPKAPAPKGDNLGALLGYSDPQEVAAPQPDAAYGNMIGQARAKYPFIGPDVVIIPKKGKGFGSEGWPAGETGDPGYTRPKEIPLHSPGIEFDTKGSIDDLAGEVLHTDGFANSVRDRMAKSFSPDQIKYLAHESLDYGSDPNVPQDIKLRNGTDSMIRGALLGQWPAKAVAGMKLTPEQQGLLDGLHSYMVTGRRAPAKPSDFLPDADTANAMATNQAQAMAEAMTRAPGVPPPPLPYGLQTGQQQADGAIASGSTFQNPRTGRIYPRLAPGTEGGPLGMLDSPITGSQQIGQGVEQMAEPGMRQKAGGLHKVIGGAFEAATPLMAATGAGAPVRTALTLGAAMVSQAAVEAGLKRLGLPKEYAAVAGDLAGIIAGTVAHTGIEGVKSKVAPVLRKRFVEAKKAKAAPPATANSVGAEPGQPLTPESFMAATPPVEEKNDVKTPEDRPAPAAASEGVTPAVPERSIGSSAAPAEGGEAKGLLAPKGWDSVEGVPHERHASVDLSDDELRTRAKNKPLPMPPGAPESIRSVWDTVSRIVPELAARVTGIGYLADDSPEHAAVNVHTGVVRIHPGRPLTAETLWHEMIHLDQPEAKAGRNALEPDAFNALEAQARSGTADALERFDAVQPAAAPVAEGKPAGEAQTPKPGSIAQVPTSDIHVDPVRFQFKRDVGRKGVGDELKSVEKYDPELGGIISVWHDPADGKTYVVNGHHRVELAQRTGHPDMTVRYLKAGDALEARAKGALINIAEGRGTPLDAAKIFRDMHYTPEDLKKAGISLKGSVARTGMGLAGLDQSIFDAVAQGESPAETAGAIGEMLPGRFADQRAVIDSIDKASARGKRMTPAEIRESIRVGLSPDQEVTHTQSTLFGDVSETHGLFAETGQISEYIQEQLRKEKRLFGSVSNEAAAQRLAGAGNVIKAEDNARIAEESSQAQEVYHKLSGKSGPVSDAVRNGARELAEGGNANAVKQRTYEAVRAVISRTLSGEKEGVSGGFPPGSEGGGGEAGAGQHDLFAGEVKQAEPEKKPAPPLTLGSGLGALEPFLRESIEDTKALIAQRAAAKAQLERSKSTPGEKNWGDQVRHFFTGERDLWIARANQGISKVRKILGVQKARRGVDTNAVVATLARQFKNNPVELKAFLDGTHPVFADIEDPEQYKRVMERIHSLRPAIERVIADGGITTLREKTADGFYTNMAAMTAAEGKKTGVLHSEWNNETYVPQILHPKGEGIVSTVKESAGKAMGGKIGKHFGFAERRQYPTLLHAIADDRIPKTMDIHAAFTYQQDQFATARATRLLEAELKDSGIGKYTVAGKAPEGWTVFAPQSSEFRELFSYPTGAIDAEGQPVTEAGERRLYVPKFIAEGMEPVTAPDYTGSIRGFETVRVSQSLTKAAQLGLSLFHAKAMNLMGAANMGLRGYAKALAADRDSPAQLAAERVFIANGGTTAIQGDTIEAYKAMQPGAIPTYQDIWRANTFVKAMDQAAAAISDFTFNNMQRRFKVTDFALRDSAWRARNPLASAEQLRIARQSIAKQVNAIYGGLHWENIGVNKATVGVARAIMLAPDWTISNIFNVKYGFERGTEAGRMTRMFWMRTLVGGLIATQLTSLMFSGRLSKRLTRVYRGTDADGREIYDNLYFSGAPGDAESLINNVDRYGAAEGLVETMASKAGPFARTGMQMYRDRDKIAPRGAGWPEKTGRGLETMAKSLAPIPWSVMNEVDMLWGPQSSKYTVPDELMAILNGRESQHVATAGTHMTKFGLKPNSFRPARAR